MATLPENEDLLYYMVTTKKKFKKKVVNPSDGLKDMPTSSDGAQEFGNFGKEFIMIVKADTTNDPLAALASNWVVRLFYANQISEGQGFLPPFSMNLNNGTFTEQ